MKKRRLDQSWFRNEPRQRQHLGVESNRSGCGVSYLTRELDSASAFLAVPRNSVADSSSKHSFQANCESKFTVEVVDYQLVAAADADGCESFDLELE